MSPLTLRTVRVISVDDYPEMHEAISDLLALAPEIQIVGQAGDGATALRLIANLERYLRRHHSDCGRASDLLQ